MLTDCPVGGHKIKRIVISLAAIFSSGIIIAITFCLHRWRARRKGTNLTTG